MSTGLMNKLKWGDSIRVNGLPRHTDFPVNVGDRITVTMEEEAPDYPAQEGALSICYEDEWLLAVDKPAGMLIHPSRSRNTDTLANYVAGYYRKTHQQSAFHPLTRLDRDTFGIVLLAKSAHVHALLQSVRPQKTYEALTFGIPDPPSGEITAPIARCALPSLLRKIDPDGKPCRTLYHVTQTRGDLARLTLIPITGRTHQLRLHCACMGTPILGDPQYGTPRSMEFSHRLQLSHQLLLAKTLSFSHPITGAPLTLSTRLPLPWPQECR